MLRILMLGLSLVFLSACGSKIEPPESVCRKFFKASIAYAQNHQIGAQAAAFELLTHETKDALALQTNTVNASLPEGVTPLKPYELLVWRQPTLGTRVTKIDRVEGSSNEERVVMLVTGEQGQVTVTMVREEAGWRVELPISSKSSQ